MGNLDIKRKEKKIMEFWCLNLLKASHICMPFNCKSYKRATVLSIVIRNIPTVVDKSNAVQRSCVEE